ncbi:12-oxophytodienoate reductase [Umezawaea sp. Da 62-37]|uniref:oxidoreductase n=1 Tax=Umezawaea sp. Da 62-37 TaxID=3075927 RepID=UPI0028F6FD5F|nr:12-oxophytodienoate reductase [Umezawaea sp. Da 62-37]WNV87126.1 12-oxophytodienoate reductase [Umezawaea sp. Da 62-37]
MPTRAAQLFSRPLDLGGLTIPNRIVMAPMTRFDSPDGVPSDDLAAYYARRAANGVGLVITESVYVDHPSAGQLDNGSRMYGDAALAGWSRAVRAVHAEGGLVFAQLQHIGMVRKAGDPPHPEAPAVGPSGVPMDGAVDPSGLPVDDNPRRGRAMTQDDIDDVVRAFAEGAATAARLGFDGVELHGAHGYLIDQFFWSRSNRRTDAYGGGTGSRARFAAEVVAEVVAAVRGAVPAGFPVVVRLSQWKSNDFDARSFDTPEDLGVVLDKLADAGADAFHASTRRYWQPAFAGSDLNLAGWTKKLSGKPAITVGSVGLDNDFWNSLTGEAVATTGIDGLLDRLESDEFDLVAIGRPLIADPEWAAKMLTGRKNEITAFTAAALGSVH